MAKQSRPEGFERPLLEAGKVKLDFDGDHKMLEAPELWNICQGQLHTKGGAITIERP